MTVSKLYIPFIGNKTPNEHAIRAHAGTNKVGDAYLDQQEAEALCKEKPTLFLTEPSCFESVARFVSERHPRYIKQLKTDFDKINSLLSTPTKHADVTKRLHTLLDLAEKTAAYFPAEVEEALVLLTLNPTFESSYQDIAFTRHILFGDNTETDVAILEKASPSLTTTILTNMKASHALQLPEKWKAAWLKQLDLANQDIDTLFDLSKMASERHPSEATPFIYELLSRPNEMDLPSFARMCKYAEESKSETLIPLLARYVESPYDYRISIYATITIGSIGGSSAAPTLISLFEKAPYSMVRTTIISTIGLLRDPVAAPWLANLMLSHPDPNIAGTAKMAFRTCHDPQSIMQVIDSVKNMIALHNEEKNINTRITMQLRIDSILFCIDDIAPDMAAAFANEIIASEPTDSPIISTARALIMF